MTLIVLGRYGETNGERRRSSFTIHAQQKNMPSRAGKTGPSLRKAFDDMRLKRRIAFVAYKGR